jgi:hypothetical protein
VTSSFEVGLRRSGFRGPLVDPGHERYASLRASWNGLHDRRPLLIAQPVSVDDVMLAIRAATAGGVPLTVRGGGHSVSGCSTVSDGLLIDMALMRSVAVDPSRRLAVAEGGCRLSDLDDATLAFGLICPSGVVSRTGLVGLALGGGFGWLTRKHGLTAGHIEGAEVVLASGDVIDCDAECHPDLHWALRGGGGNFGVVTKLLLRLQDAVPALRRTWRFPSTVEVSHRVATALTALVNTPPELSTFATVSWAAACEPGASLKIDTAWFGDPDEKLIEGHLDGFSGARLEFEGVVSMRELQRSMNGVEPDGLRYYTSSRFVGRLDSRLLRDLFHLAARSPSLLSTIDINVLGGHASGDSGLPAEARLAPFQVSSSAAWESSLDDEACSTWARELPGVVAEYASGGNYVNYMPRASISQLAEVYGAPVFQRLREIKGRYDPSNLFAGSQNIPPLI